MKSSRITSLLDRFANAGGFKYVKVSAYNNLYDDVLALNPGDGLANINTISEYTSGSGVTVDGVLLKDSAVDTNVAAAGVTLSGTTLAADGTDSAIPITITPKASNIQSVAGTEALPTYSFTGDPNTGFFSQGADKIGMSIGGDEKWRFSADLLPVGGSNYDIGSSTYPVYRIFTGGVGGGVQQPDAAQYGSTPVGTVAIKHYGDGKDITTVLTLTNFIVGTIPAADAALAVGNIVFAFPAGAHVESTYYSSLALTLPGDANAASVVGIGSVIGSTAVAVLNGTATFMDRSTEVTTPTASAGGAVTTSLKNVTAGAFTGIGLNASGSIKNVFLNAAGTWVTNNAGNLTATGTITFKWTIMS